MPAKSTKAAFSLSLSASFKIPPASTVFLFSP
nr:MAG TPA: hypothetical protein [Bacteriophage sp.]